jgi:sugar/nucleoside kinase (ribokinase family)
VAGVGFGTAAALTTLGTDVRLATLVGNDHFGPLVRSSLHDHHLDGPGMVSAAGPRGRGSVGHA